MSNIEYEVKRQRKTLTTKEFYDRFSNFEVVQGYCRGCSRYNTNYSCSPLDIDIQNYIESYDYIDIVITQLFFNKEDYQAIYSPDELNDILNNTFFIEKKKTVDILLDEEKKYVKSECITGPCNYCRSYCKKEYDECIHPEIRRYSLASLGIDSAKILKDLFNIDLILIEGKLPKYLNNVSSILHSK